MRRKVGKMKSKGKSIVMILITLGILFALSPVINNGLNFNAGINDNFSENCDDSNFDNQNLKLSKVSGPIYINDVNPSFNWSVAKGAGKCTGNGTYSEPYVIEDLEIDSGGSGSCIWIQNSDVHFIIENCSLYNLGINWGDSGIRLYNVDNGQLINNSVYNSQSKAILLEYSNNNNVSRNRLYNITEDGLGVWYGDNNSISENMLTNIGWAISLHSSDFNNISKNEVNNNTQIGIELYDSNNNNISENEVNENGEVGIVLEGCNDTTISGNTASHNGGGIGLGNANYTRIFNNTIKHSSGGGIIIGGNNNWISQNYVDNNTWGMGFGDGHNNIVIDNNVHNSSANGIEVYSDNQTFLNNIITNNGLGIMISSSYNNISGNIANNNVDAGISLEGNNNIISGNTVSYNNYSGISVNYGDFNKFTNNIANYNAEHGLSLAVNYSTVSGNTANHNDQFGIMINGDFNNVSENTASYNGQNGITLDGNSDNCILFLNDITGNLLHSGYDDGTNNQWDNGTIGHYWEEYTGKDADDDGIGDTPYTIPGTTGSQDNYPIWWDAPIISIDSPTANATFNNTAPGYEISIEGIPQSMWYTIGGIAGNFPITELNGTIDQDTWDSLDDGDITITFYAQDSESEIGSLSIIVIKYIPSTPATDGIPGYNLFFLFGVLSVVATIISIKLKKFNK